MSVIPPEAPPADITEMYQVAYGVTPDEAYRRLLASWQTEFPAWAALLVKPGFQLVNIAAVPEEEAADLAVHYLTLLAGPCVAADAWRVMPVRAMPPPNPSPTLPPPPSRPRPLPAWMFFGWVDRP